MSKITICRTNMAFPENMEAASYLLFKVFDGFSKPDRKAWRRFWSKMKEMEPGEIAQIDMLIPRDKIKHRKFFALLNVGFDAWEPGRKHKTYKGREVAKDFERFREDVTILAGFYEQTFDLRGKMSLKAKSISFANMDDIEFERLYSAVARVLLEKVLTTYAGREELDEIVEKIMRFGE